MPVLTEAELSAFLSQAEQPDQLPQITGWSKEDKIPIKGEVREAVSGTLWKIAGSMEMFFAGQLKEGNYPWEEDEEGCLISSGLAEKLFGTERIQGNQVQILGKTYIVRGCIKAETLLLLSLQKQKTGWREFLCSIQTTGSPALWQRVF